jgi:hypothetical protein
MTPSPPVRLSRRSVVRAGLGAAAAAPAWAVRRRSARAQGLPADGVRAVYLNPLATDAAQVRALFDLIDATELNAVVVDVKEDGVYLPTAVELFVDAGGVAPQVLDAEALLAEARARGIWTIARVVTFRDAYLARARPDLAVLDAETGEPWLSYDGLAWLNPLKQETWEAYHGFTRELAERGFDEIQFDYVRFPSDGDLWRMDFGVPIDEALRSDTIAAFLGSCRERLAPLGAVTAADIFGYTLLLDDIGIGQNVGKIARNVDVLCPMVYPSHFPEGSILVPGHPNDFPAETIAISMEAGARRVDPSRLRPWLQDFSLAGMSDYGPAEVRAQIDAAEAGGAGGWMLWSADSVYTSAALAPESGGAG